MTEIKIGKNAIENLTRGMYEDSRIIFREYIQNAADQIDYATKYALFDDDLFIDINIDVEGRNVIIKDNATGIRKDLVPSKLAYVADSDKLRGETKGFRGIGRLGGLAYCEKLRFITTAKGENQKTIMTWDAAALNRMLDDPSVKDSASAILEKIISYEYEECPIDEHYFIVEMLGISNENVDLLDVKKIKQYIALNAPVPYESKFLYRKKIHEYLDKKGLPKNEYKIYVNGEDILKPYTTILYESTQNGQRRKYDELYDIKIEEFYDDSGQLLAWMWYGISRFEKQIPFPLNETAGIRLRQSNIQIGNERTLARFFKEPRGYLYFVGEVHAVHKELTPNARRDYFNENRTRNEFEKRLKEYFHSKLHYLYFEANKAKNAYKKEITLLRKEDEYSKKKGRFISDRERQKIESEVEAAKTDNKKAQRDLEKLREKAKNDEVLRIVLERIEDNHLKTLESLGYSKTNQVQLISSGSEQYVKEKREGYLVDELSHLPAKQRKLIARIYEIIAQNLPPAQSEELISKIQEELKNGKKSTIS